MLQHQVQFGLNPARCSCVFSVRRPRLPAGSRVREHRGIREGRVGSRDLGRAAAPPGERERQRRRSPVVGRRRHGSAESAHAAATRSSNRIGENRNRKRSGKLPVGSAIGEISDRLVGALVGGRSAPAGNGVESRRRFRNRNQTACRRERRHGRGGGGDNGVKGPEGLWRS